MTSPSRILGQALFYAAFAGLLASLADGPAWQHLPPGQAEIKLSMSVVGDRIRPCRRFSPEELAQLAPNMRRPSDCPRERLPVAVELLIDGEVLYSETHAAAGLWKDGPSRIYRRFAVASGSHVVTVRVRTSNREVGHDLELTREVSLAEAENLVVDFRQRTSELTIG